MAERLRFEGGIGRRAGWAPTARPPYRLPVPPPSSSIALSADSLSSEAQVVVSDQRMPEMSGVDLLSTVREQHPDMVRMMLTGYTEMNIAVYRPVARQTLPG